MIVDISMNTVFNIFYSVLENNLKSKKTFAKDYWEKPTK